MRRRVRGQSMVEMALILPFLVLILLGTIELGYYIYTYSELENATRRASEWAAKTPPVSATDPNNPSDKCLMLIKQSAADDIFLGDATQVYNGITVSYPNSPALRQPGEQIQVQLSNYQGQWLTPIGRNFFGNTLRFTFTSRRTIVNITPPAGLDANCE